MLLTKTYKITTQENSYILGGEQIRLVEKTTTALRDRQMYNRDYTGIDYDSYVRNILFSQLEHTKEQDLYGLMKTLSERNNPITQVYNFQDPQRLFNLIDVTRITMSSDFIITNTTIANEISQVPSFRFTQNINSSLCYKSGNLSNRLDVIVNPNLGINDNTILFGKTFEIIYIEKRINFHSQDNIINTEDVASQYLNFVSNINSYNKFKKITLVNVNEMIEDLDF